MSKLPRILLVSEMTLNEELMGANRTLLNLFETYPADLLMLFSPSELLDKNPPMSRFEKQVLPFVDNYIPLLRNRIGLLINPLIVTINLQLMDALPIPYKKRLEEFAPEVVLICPITTSCLLMGHKLISHLPCPSLVYFMDDWMVSQNAWWLTGNTGTITQEILKRASGWLMISKQLTDILSLRYQLTPKELLVVHNPVDLAGKNISVKLQPRNTFKVVYAGSIWPMHYDALAVMAEAICELRKDGINIELELCTNHSFWDMYGDKWRLWGVKYGSFIPYYELDEHLKSADLLLVASSFLPENMPFTRSSVQTKLTDYMAAGRPILSFGPRYSACNQFVKEWNCGLVCETNQISDVKKFLLEQMSNRHLNQKKAEVAFEVLKNNFEKNSVCKSLYEFISEIAINR